MFFKCDSVCLFKSSLAWRNLIHNKRSFWAALLTVSFTIFLMFLQLGFRNGMLDSNVEFLQKLDADLILTSRRRYTALVEYKFKKAMLAQAREFEEVESAYPFYITIGIWKSKQGIRERPIRVFAFNPAHSVFLIPAIKKSMIALRLPYTLLTDQKSHKDFGSMAEGTVAELSSHKVKVVGTFELGTDFNADGNLIMSDQNFLRIFSEQPSGFEGYLRSSLNEVDLGLLKVAKRTDVDNLVEVLNKSLSSDVVVYSKRSFINRELKYLNQATPIGFVFALGTAIGFVVGVIVVYNIIYTDIEDNLPQYATLRAMGYSNSYFIGVFFLESIILAILSFFPGFLSSILIYKIIANATGLLMRKSLSTLFLVLILTIVMCMFAGFMAARRIQNIDPAEVYVQKF